MQENPCKWEEEAFRLAVEAWVEASELVQSYMVTKPLNPNTAMTPRSKEYIQQMRMAFDREQEARKRYIEANQVYLDCIKRHGLGKPFEDSS
jgi:hypothetical protein